MLLLTVPAAPWLLMDFEVLVLLVLLLLYDGRVLILGFEYVGVYVLRAELYTGLLAGFVADLLLSAVVRSLTVLFVATDSVLVLLVGVVTELPSEAIVLEEVRSAVVLVEVELASLVLDEGFEAVALLIVLYVSLLWTVVE